MVNPAPGARLGPRHGRLAKTDRLDAQALAHFGQAVRPTPRPLPDEEAQALAALVERRRQVVAMRTAEENRLGATRVALVRTRIQAHLAWLETDLREVDDDLRRRLRASPLWREQDDLLRSVPGIGPILVADVAGGLARAGTALPRSRSPRWSASPRSTATAALLRGRRAVWGGRGRCARCSTWAPCVATRCNPVHPAVL